MDDRATPVDRPHGQSDGLLIVSYKPLPITDRGVRGGRWEQQDGLELLVDEPPPPALIALVDPSKDEHGGRGRRTRRDYSRVNFLSDGTRDGHGEQPRLFDAY